jgi:hypothetical protein
MSPKRPGPRLFPPSTSFLRPLVFPSAPGEVVEADAKIAAPQALQDAASRENPIQHGDSFLAASGLTGSLVIMRTGSDRLLR